MNLNCKIAFVGAGSFANNLYHVFHSAGCSLEFVVDELKSGDFLSAPIVKACTLTEEDIEGIDKFVIAISIPEYSLNARKRLIRSGVPKGKIFYIDDLPSLTILSFLFTHYSDKAIAAFKSSSITDVFAFEKAFLSDEWSETFAGLNPNKKTIAFSLYSKGGGFRRHIGGLIPRLVDNFNVIALSDEKVENYKLGVPELFMGPATAAKINELDAVITAHVGVCSHERVPRVNFLHSSFWFVECDNAVWRQWMRKDIESADPNYIVAPTSSIFEMYKSILEEEDIKNRVCLIPCGYPRLDDNIEYFESARHEQNSIIYAPTLSFNNSEDTWRYGSISQSANIVKALLESFPDKNIITRFHPRDMAYIESMQGNPNPHPHLQPFLDIYELSKVEPRCLIDSNKTFYMDTYSKCSVMISDLSSTGYSYALSTNCPTVFFSPNEAELWEKYSRSISSFIRDRGRVGLVVDSVADMISAVKRSLSQPHDFEREIGSYRNEVCYNLGRSEEYFIENIDYILNGEKHPDWTYFNWS